MCHEQNISNEFSSFTGLTPFAADTVTACCYKGTVIELDVCSNWDWQTVPGAVDGNWHWKWHVKYSL
jgi:hypothetical protein